MKKQFFIFIFLLTIVWHESNAGEFTGAGRAVEAVLTQNNISVEALKKSGHEVVKGEFTGAGKTLQFGQVSFFVTKDEVIPRHQVDLLEIGANDLRPVPGSQTLGGLKRLEAFGRTYNPTEIKGLVIKQ